VAQTCFTTANLDIALTKVRDGCPAEYTGRYQDLFQFHRLLLVAAGDPGDVRIPGRRRIARRHCFLRAEIFIPGWPVVPCLIRDVSTDGAGLILGEPLALPEQIDLHILEKIAVPVEVKWCKALTLGVEFRVRQRAADLSVQV
jgi:hypothetical protein